MEEVRVLELFSGVGGMARAAELAGPALSATCLTVVAAVDINTVSNEVYRHNHPAHTLLQRNITGLTSEELEQMAPDLVLLSPPCQPHTRQGRQRDTADPRSDPLAHLLTILPDLPSLRYLLLENVAGFETSEARRRTVERLASLGWHCMEFLLCPRHLGVPNSRLRYYLLARRGRGWGLPNELQTSPTSLERARAALALPAPPPNLTGYLQPDHQVGNQFQLPTALLERHRTVLDIVTREAESCCCFTGGYTRYAKGTGSVLCTGTQEQLDTAYREEGRGLDRLLRYFTPTEVAALLGFPSQFSFPASVSTKQQYKLLGNSISVPVVALLIVALFTDLDPPQVSDPT